MSEWEQRLRRELHDLPPPAPRERYDVHEELGRGGMAVVHRAFDRTLGREVALKFLRDDRSVPETLRARFRREAEAVARLSHPGIVAVYDAGEIDGRLFIAMELVKGVPMAKTLDAALLEKVARAVHHAHEQGVVHRDLKPSNILVAAGEPKVVDFGLARFAESELTTGAVGTPAYMAPEQIAGRADAKTDVYALGAILYEMLAGQPPFRGETLAVLYQQILHDEPAPPGAGPLAAVALQALRKDPARRMTAIEFAEELGRFRAGEPVLARPDPAWRAIASHAGRHRTAIVAITTIVVLVVLLLRHDPYPSAYAAAMEEWNRSAPLFRLKGESAARAEELFRRAAVLAPHRSEPWLMIGRCRKVARDVEGAAEAFTAALKRDPSFGPARLERGRQAFDRYARLRPPSIRLLGSHVVVEVPDESDAARQWRERGEVDLASRAGLNAAELRSLEGALAYGSGRYEAAAAALAGYVHEAPWDAEAYAMLGAAQFFAGQPALEAWDAALSLENRQEWRIARAHARLREGRAEEALADYDDAGRALALQLLGRYEEAERLYALLLDRAPDDARTLVNRGTLRAARRDFDAAIADFERALLRAPRDAYVYLNLGNVQLLRGDLDEALQSYATAVDLDPRLGEAQFQLGRLLLGRDREKGAAHLQKALESAGAERRAEIERLLRR